ncbi:hypothetical protein BTJ78_001329 [Escherichia coli]|nr:hypothetical protein [Escherichia coli]EFF8893104.1 hypothetical protein [Escherichia coli]
MGKLQRNRVQSWACESLCGGLFFWLDVCLWCGRLMRGGLILAGYGKKKPSVMPGVD